MAIPGYQAIMRPLLEALADGSPHVLVELQQPLAAHFGLSDVELGERLESGAPVFANRVAWAATYLSKAGVINRPGRGLVSLTPRGRTLLAEGTSIDNSTLRAYADFKDWRKRKASTQELDHSEHSDEEDTATPEDLMEEGYRRHSTTVKAELLERFQTNHPDFFEKAVILLLEAMGFGTRSARPGRVVGGAGDNGIDGLIDEDALGLDAVYVQAKRYEKSVGPDTVRDFIGAMDLARATKGVIITSGTFTKNARTTADGSQRRIRLIDGAELASLCLRYGVGVSTGATYRLHEVDSDFFET